MVRPAGAAAKTASPQHGHARLDIVILGMTITSSWGNGHATTYRALVRELARRGHHVLFLEHDKPRYAQNRDMPEPPFGRTELYHSAHDLRRRFGSDVRSADAVIVGSSVPQGLEVGAWVTATARGVSAFYDMDTPLTLAKLPRRDCEYLAAELIPRYQLYLSSTGGPILAHLEQRYGSPAARALYCSADPNLYHPEPQKIRWDLGYIGTYSEDRHESLETLMLEPARRSPRHRFTVAGPMYPPETNWPVNVERFEHLPPGRHRAFYNAQRFALNITRADMIRAGYSPSVRLFEAAACGVPIISDWWEGLEMLLTPGHEILVARSPQDTLDYLHGINEHQRLAIGHRARQRILRSHTAAKRAEQLESYLLEVQSPSCTTW